MQVTCKHCQSVLQVDSKNHGKKTRCGNCKQAFVIVDPKQVAAAKKAKRVAEAKAWEESIKPMPSLPKREFKKKVKGSRLNKPFSIESWLLDTARQWIVFVYFLVSAFYMLAIGTGLASIFFVTDGRTVMVSLVGSLVTLLIWVVFTIGYALFAAPVIALIRIEKNTRKEGN
jgi:predicted Zn finger-like uncharacterized protein